MYDERVEKKQLVEAKNALLGVEKIAQAKSVKSVAIIKNTTSRIERYCFLICILLIGLIASQLYGLNVAFTQFQTESVTAFKENGQRHCKTTRILQRIHQQLSAEYGKSENDLDI